MESVLVAQEIMHSLKIAPRTRSLMALKIDMEKAFDKVCWNFLFRVLSYFSFHPHFINWIKICVSSLDFALLINGVPPS